jgi:hypothetical protein
MKSKFQVEVKIVRQRQGQNNQPMKLQVEGVVHRVWTNKKEFLKYGNTSKMLKNDLFDAHITENNTR